MEVVKNPVAIPAYAAPEASTKPVEESLEEKAIRIAKEYGIDQESLFNLIACESSWNPKADNQEDRGLVQINRLSHPEISDAEAFDPDFAIDYAAKSLSKGKGYMWTCGNCYLYAKLFIKDLPKMADILPNTDYPNVGGLIIFSYAGVKHIAVIEQVLEKGIYIKEANFHSNLIARRLVKWDDERIIGYWRNQT